jgi:O-antigen ligase
LLLAPLFKAGNRPLPLLLLELAAIAFLFTIVALRRLPTRLPRLLLAGAGILLLYPLVQIIPIPEFIWRELPGHAEYATVLEQFAAGGWVGPWRAISIVPSATEYGWLALLPPIACFCAVLTLSPDQCARLLLFLAVAAGAQALLGLLQIGPAGGGLLYLGNEEPGQRVAIGTFVNRNHLAGMLSMTLPVIVGLLVYSMRPGRYTGKRRPARMLTSEAIAQRTLLFASAVLILLCLLFTRSRAGIASGFAGLASAAIVLVRARAAVVGTSRTKAASYVVAGIVVAAVVAALVIGAAPIVRGLDPRAVQTDADFRWSIYAASMHAALEFLPLGSGLSTFANIFPRFQFGDLGGFIDYAHNDYLQALLELGLAGPAFIILLLVAYGLRLIELLLDEGGRSFTLLQIAAALGMLPMMLHSLFDFAIHMPANAMWFATLAGVVFHKGVAPRDNGHRERRRSKSREPQRVETPTPDVPS